MKGLQWEKLKESAGGVGGCGDRGPQGVWVGAVAGTRRGK